MPINKISVTKSFVIRVLDTEYYQSLLIQNCFVIFRSLHDLDDKGHRWSNIHSTISFIYIEFTQHYLKNI